MIDHHIVKLVASYPDTPVMIHSVMRNGKLYRHKYSSVSDFYNDKKNPHLFDVVDEVSIERSLFNKNNEFIMVYTHEE